MKETERKMKKETMSKETKKEIEKLKKTRKRQERKEKCDGKLKKWP